MGETRKIKVSSRDNAAPNVISDGWHIEAEYAAMSAADRDAAFAFVERIVRLLSGRQESSGREEA